MGSLANFIDLLEQTDQLLRIKTATHWRHDIGAYIRAEQHQGKKRALLFESITDYPDFTLFANGFGTRRHLYQSLGIADSIKDSEALQTIKKRFNNPVAPTIVKHPEVDQTLFTGNAINLYNLPSPVWHPLDAGRYIGTWHLNITHDPETQIRNVGVYRMMVLNEHSTTLSVSRNSHIALHIRKAHASGKALPMVVSIGVGEPLLFAAAAALGQDIDELATAGGLCEKTISIAPCSTIDLHSPSDAEITLEGHIPPDVRPTDGPFFDYAGVATANPRAYRFDVSAIRLRRPAIFRGAAIGLAGAEDHVLYALLARLNLVNFHGNSAKRRLQTFLFRLQWFKLLQWSGRTGTVNKMIGKK